MGCLLHYALESHWDLTEEGWKKVEELGLLTNREKKSGAADIEDDEDVWIQGQAVQQLHREASTKSASGVSRNEQPRWQTKKT